MKLFFCNFAQTQLMLENIHIQNFRCFEDFKAEGFERVNLIGGKNNSGKTCLLEGIYLLNDWHNHERLNVLHKLRSVHSGYYKDFVAYNQNKSVPIKFIYNGINDINLLLSNELEFEDSLSNKEPKEFYNVQYLFDFKLSNLEYYDKFFTVYDNFEPRIKARIKSYLENIFELEIESVNNKEYLIYIKTKQTKIELPIYYFGDAFKVVFNVLVSLFNSNSKRNILLIDEIENGLHYTAHEKFWQHIFKLSKELYVQVFATTHSLEMIQQFNKVAKKFEKENPEDKGAYFEMMRNVRTNKIVAHKYNEEELEYSLENEKTFRGE